MFDFYKENYGSVLGIGIKKHVYAMVSERFESNIRASYSITEIVDESKKVKHNLIRESLLRLGIKNQIEVVTIADVPGSGTGLGSSSSTLVGLLYSLSCFVNNPFEKHELAEISSEIEINKLHQPIGKQDHYFAAYGGINYFRFNADGSVIREKIHVSKNTEDELESNILCYYTGIGRKSSDILTEQKNNISKRKDVLLEMRNQAEEGKKILKCGDLIKFGEMLNKGWELKKKLAKSISNDRIELYYQKALKAGALGGKLSGAGGGGFLTLFCEEKNHDSLRQALADLKEMKIGIDKLGSIIVKES